jgi:hypothetical protein
LEVEAAVALFVSPVGVHAPEEAVFVSVGEGVFAGRAGVGDLGDAGAAGGAGAALRAGAREGDVVGGVEDDGENVVLADAQGGGEAVAVLREDGGLEDLGREDAGIGGKVAQEEFKVGGASVGNEGGAAPVVKEGFGDVGCRGDLVDEEFAATEAGGLVGGGEGLKAPAVEAGFDGADVSVKGLGRGRRRAGEGGRDGDEEEDCQ